MSCFGRKKKRGKGKKGPGKGLPTEEKRAVAG